MKKANSATLKNMNPWSIRHERQCISRNFVQSHATLSFQLNVLTEISINFCRTFNYIFQQNKNCDRIVCTIHTLENKNRNANAKLHLVHKL